MAARRIFCIGRNYVAHAAELGNEVPTSPVVFIKPETCLVEARGVVRFPAHGNALHHEAELVVELGEGGSVAALGLGLDLTLRDVQDVLKRAGLPWEKAKAFEQSSPLGPLVPYDTAQHDLRALRFECRVNGELRQQGDTSLMVFPVETLVAELGRIWRLAPGDLIYTGTPAGVGPLAVGDVIEVRGEGLASASWQIVA